MVHLPAHIIEQLMDCVHLQIAGFKALDGIADRQLLGSTHQDWLITLVFLRIRYFVENCENGLANFLFRTV